MYPLAPTFKPRNNLIFKTEHITGLSARPSIQLITVITAESVARRRGRVKRKIKNGE